MSAQCPPKGRALLRPEQVASEVAAYRQKLVALAGRFFDGERFTVAVEAQSYADALTCLLEEAPLDQREAIDYLIDRCEALRAACSN